MSTETNDSKTESKMTPEEIEYWVKGTETDSHTIRLHNLWREEGKTEEQIAEFEQLFG